MKKIICISRKRFVSEEKDLYIKNNIQYTRKIFVSQFLAGRWGTYNIKIKIFVCRSWFYVQLCFFTFYVVVKANQLCNQTVTFKTFPINKDWTLVRNNCEYIVYCILYFVYFILWIYNIHHEMKHQRSKPFYRDVISPPRFNKNPQLLL